MRSDALDALLMIGAMVLAVLVWMFGIPSAFFWRANRKRRSE